MCTDNSLLTKRLVRILAKFSERVASFLLQGNKDLVKYLEAVFWGAFFVFVPVNLVSYKIVHWAFIRFSRSPQGGMEF